jgi:1-aminocyclopropane-1-carboxylate deaminase
MFELSNSIIQEVHPWFLNNTKKKLFIKRDDLIHEFVSGNKWRKLKYSIDHVLKHKFEGVITFGGAYSNHLLATAAACAQFKLPVLAIVRGEELAIESNHILTKCNELGMKFRFVTREEYSDKNEKSYQEMLRQEFPGYYLIPEGGANYLGIIGCQEIMRENARNIDSVFVAQGTTTTSCGILSSLRGNSLLHVVPVLKGFDSLKEMQCLFTNAAFDQEWIEDMLEKVEVHTDFHFGGYGKYTPELLNFMERFFSECQVPLDPIYTGKAMYALMEHCNHTAQKEEDILFIHTGGIEGGRAIAYEEQRFFC